MMYSRAVRVLLLGLLVCGLPMCLPAATAQSADDEELTPEASVLEDPLVRYQAKRGLDLLYNMRFDRAATLFELVDQRYPEHPIGPFLKALNTWWEILLDLSDTSHDAAFFDAMQEVIDRSDRLLAEDPQHFDAQFFKGAALGFRGRHRSNRGNWYRAAMDGRRAMGYVLNVADADPENDDFVFGRGIYDYYADVIPERYAYVRPVMVFFPDGDRERGLDLLKRTAAEGHYIQTEATYFLLQIHYLFERDYSKSIEYVTQLLDQHPGNAFFHAYKGRVHARWGRWMQARHTFTEVLERYQNGQAGYNDAVAEQALFFIGRSHLAQGEPQAALQRLQQLDALAARREEDAYFQVVGRLYQGMAYDALAERSLAERRYREVLAMDDQGNAHDLAERYLDRPYRQR